VTGRLARIRTVWPIDRMVGAYLLLTAAVVVVIAGVGPSPEVVYAVVAALVVRDVLFGLSAALIWRGRASLGRGLLRLVSASIADSARRHR
jgi:hypothetical protein